MYPTYYFLSNLFSISVPVVGREITNILPLFCEQVKAYLVWPTVAEWRAMRETWAKLPSAGVCAIDGTSHRFYRPEVEPQELYYSGHRHFHCIHTQVVVDVHGTIRYIESGYQDHLNDAQQYALMQEIRTGLQFLDELVLLGDKIYPNHGAVITPYTSTQLAQKQPLERRECRKLNSLIKLYRVRVEQSIGELKTYRSVSLLWRHPRTMLTSTVKSCAVLVCRRKEIGLII